MNVRVIATSVALLTALALIAFGFADYLNPLIGVPKGGSSLLNSFWSLEAIAIGFSILAGYLSPHVRGVKEGDKLVAVGSAPSDGDGGMAFVSAVPVTALESGRVGAKIKVRLDPGHHGEGVILSYAGTFSPAMVKMTEREW